MAHTTKCPFCNGKGEDENGERCEYCEDGLIETDSPAFIAWCKEQREEERENRRGE